MSFKLPESHLKAYDRAAEAAGMSRSEWVRLILDAASGVSDLPAQMARIKEHVNKPVDDGKW